MKRLILVLAVLLAVSASAEEGKSFKLLTVGDADATALRDYMQTQGLVAVELGGAFEPAEAEASLDVIGRAAVAANAADDSTFAVILYGRFGLDRPQGVCLPSERFAVLNLDRLESAGDPAKAARRAGQEGLRVMAMLLDMPACPFPLCALVGYQKTEDLDRMSGNFCPPCQERFQRLAQEKGIRLLPPVVKD